MKECNEKNREENNMFYLKWIWESILKKKDSSELSGNQQWKNMLVEGLWKTSQELEVKTCHKQKQLLAWERRRDENIFHRENRRKLGLLISTPIATFLREGFSWNITQDNFNEEIDGFKIPHSWQHVNHETWTQVMKNDIAPPQMIR